MPILFMTFGSIFAVMGFVFLIRAIFGRRITDHPFCRRCRYDLIGLNLSTPSPCPECGHTVLIDSRSVINGRRRVRFILLAIALVMMTVGSAGIGWSSIKRHPSLEYVDWNVIYEQSSEPALRLYESLNDEEATYELYRRMTKGKISDKGLRTLIDRAMKHIADPSASYDFRWGSVLLYALYDNKLTDSERTTFIEGSVTSQIHISELQSRDTPTAHAVISHHGIERFMGSWMTTIPLQRKDRPIDTMRATSDFVIQCTHHILTINGTPATNQDNWKNTSSDWAEIGREFATSRIHVPFPPDQHTLDIAIAINYVLLRNDAIVHTWSQTLNTSVQRADGVIQHAQRIETSEILDPILKNLSIGSVFVPTQMNLAMNAPESQRRVRQTLSIYSKTPFDHKLLGQIRFRVRAHEIPYQSIEWSPPYSNQSPRFMGRIGCGPGGWTWSGASGFDQSKAYFDQHQSFWEEALKVGKVDVLIIPNPHMAEQNPRIASFINRTIIFKDVPVSPQVPRILARTNSLTGQPIELLRWSPKYMTSKNSLSPINATLLTPN